MQVVLRRLRSNRANQSRLGTGAGAKLISALGETMRRRLGRLIPIVLLAVLVQVFAPIAAFRVVAYAVSDPLYLEAICSDTSASDTQVAPSNAPHPRGKCCGFCSISHAGTAAVAPPAPIFVVLQRQFQRVLWLQASNPVPTIRVGSNAQARAPPFNS